MDETTTTQMTHIEVHQKLWGNLTFCKHVALHCATRSGEDTSTSAKTPIHDNMTENMEKLNNILAHIFFGIPL